MILVRRLTTLPGPAVPFPEVPVGALVTFGPETSALLTAGQHGTTFGGNPVATAAALATLHVLESQDILAHVRSLGEHLRAGLAGIPGITEVRGEGLLIGFDLDADVAPGVVTAGLDAGFIVNSPGPRTIRLAPPLILTAEQADRFLAALPALLATAKAEQTADQVQAEQPATSSNTAAKDAK
jgi:acetylornithine aminotransferase